MFLLLLLSSYRRLHVHYVSSTETRHLEGEDSEVIENSEVVWFVVDGNCWSTSDNVGRL